MPLERSQSPQDALKSAQAHYDAQLPNSDCPRHFWCITGNPRHWQCCFCGQIEEIAPEFEE